MCQYRSNCHYFVSVSCTLGPASLCRDMKIFKDCRSIQFTSVSSNVEEIDISHGRPSSVPIPGGVKLIGIEQCQVENSYVAIDRWHQGGLPCGKQICVIQRWQWLSIHSLSFQSWCCGESETPLEQECGMVHTSALVQITFTAMSSSVQQLCHSLKEFHCDWCARKLF